MEAEPYEIDEKQTTILLDDGNILMKLQNGKIAIS